MSVIKAFQKAPRESGYQCLQCDHVLHLKEGQLLPPCPKCGFREYQQTDALASC